MADKNTEKLITVREAAKECGRNMETVRRWIWAGKLPAEKLGNQLFIKEKDFVSYCLETAVKYRAEADPEFLEKVVALRVRMKARGAKPIDAGEEIRQMREEQMNKIDLRMTEPETGIRSGAKASLIDRMRNLREEIHTRTGKVFDAETMIRELREERDKEIR